MTTIQLLSTSAVVQEGGADASKQVADPYANEPRRHRALKVQSDKPFNAETPLDALASSSSTPTELFYVRNHLPVPHVNPAGYSVCPCLLIYIAYHYSSTPTELCYVRNHLLVPHIDPAGYSICPRLLKFIACLEGIEAVFVMWCTGAGFA